ncbi:MAG: GNAT family N-acetyltransferase [Deltaproteobacteria bacterium]|nr:MAG: GNAT family N-acetyltransferase [Deltaproteobacteria bacterium]
MTFQLVHPETLPPDLLDDLLAQGWYRMRQAVFTCRYLLGRRGLHTAVWTRLPLRGYRFRKSLRRRLRRIEGRYAVRIHPWRMTEEHAELYRRYRAHVGGDRSDELEQVLQDESERDIFDSWEVEIRDVAGRLVAFSVFDRGRRSLESVLGVYDPDCARDGLGIATMLLEIRYGVEHGYHYHYAGYIVPGVPAFDYKRAVGGLEFYDPRADAWRPLSELDENQLPARQLQRALEQVCAGLAARGIPHQLCWHPPFRVVHMNGLQGRCMASPLFVDCGPGEGSELCLAVTYDPERGGYALEAFVRAEDLADRMGEGLAPDDGTPVETHLLVRVDRAGLTRDPQEVVAWVHRAWRAAERRRVERRA